MISLIYDFFYSWLFSGGIPTNLPINGAEFICILMTVVTLLFVLYLAILPIKIIVRKILGG